MIKHIYNRFRRFQSCCSEDEISVYAAQASFFLVLSSFPFFLLLLTLIRLVPGVGKEDLLLVLSRLTPLRIYSLLEIILNDLYRSAPAALLSVTSVTALWSASRGMLGIERGLNRIAGTPGRIGFFKRRLTGSFYTLILLFVCLLSLILMVFGSALQEALFQAYSLPAGLRPWLSAARALSVLLLLSLFFAVLYRFVPMQKKRMRHQLPGAFFATAGWTLCSFFFSVYFHFAGQFTYLYGRLASVALLMLWLYLCLWILFLGAELNRFRILLRQNR